MTLMWRWLSCLFLFSLILSPGFAQESPVTRENLPAPEIVAAHSLSAAQEREARSALHSLREASRRGLTTLRIIFIATDDQYAGVKEAIEEAEHALEPPMREERFWRRKLEIIKSLGLVFKGELPPVFDLRRSFQNVTRLTRVSENFDNPWSRQMLLNSAAMFALTHGGEFASGVTMGTYQLAQLGFAEAVAWYGLAIPGLYDFGCWIGQGVILSRQGRALFNGARQVVVMAGGKAIDLMGLPHALETIFEREDVRERILRAQRNAKTNGFEIQIPDQEAMRLKIRNREGREVVELQFAEGKRKGELVLEYAKFAAEMKDVPYRDLYPSIKDLGWNVVGALRQAHFLIRNGREDLIESEKTFVGAVAVTADAVEILFREEAVWMKPKRKWREGMCSLMAKLVGG